MLVSTILLILFLVIVFVYIFCAWVMVVVKKKGIPIFAMYTLPRAEYGPEFPWLWDRWSAPGIGRNRTRGICIAGLEIVINPRQEVLDDVRKIRSSVMIGKSR